jgi:hypothetical protein
MKPLFPLAPRYRLDDESIWLHGIDPSRRYWIEVNGDDRQIVNLPGLTVSSFEDFKQAILQFRALQPGEQMQIDRASDRCTVCCISDNCYAIEPENASAPVWHLFDRETLESLLMSAHPDWKCAAKDVDLGRKMLMRAFKQPLAAA